MTSSAKTLLGGALAAALAAGTALPVHAAPMGDSAEPIKLAMNEWTGQHITTKVAGQILEKMGYRVEYVTAGYYPQLTAIRDNDISATLEIWSSNIGEHYAQALASGQAVALGDLGLKPVETWHYNKAAARACPGLPDWQALKQCAEAFATADTFPDGRLLDYPADWGTTNVDRLSALGLPLKSVPAGSEGALIAEIKSAESKGQPLLVMFWSPHWVFAEVDLDTVSLPPYQDGCYEDPKVGPNPDKTYDCDWSRGFINKVAWAGMQKKWPAAYEFLKRYQLRNADQIPMMAAVDQQGKDLDAVVAQWVQDNQSVWQPWVDAAKM